MNYETTLYTRVEKISRYFVNNESQVSQYQKEKLQINKVAKLEGTLQCWFVY